MERLRIELSSKAVTIHSQADEIALLYTEVDKLRMYASDSRVVGDIVVRTHTSQAWLHALFSVHDKLERKKHQVALLEDKLVTQQLETVRLVHASEAAAHTCEQLRDELQFLRDAHVDDFASRDEDRLAQLELTAQLRARELELQQQLEEQQRKWAADRSTMLQQRRLLEKEKQLAEEEQKLRDVERAALSMRTGAVNGPWLRCGWRSDQIKLTMVLTYAMSALSRTRAANDGAPGAARARRY